MVDEGVLDMEVGSVDITAHENGCPIPEVEYPGLEIEKALKKPFDKKDLQWRVAEIIPPRGDKGPQARVLCYVTARAVMDRLDDVVGSANWKDEYEHKDNGVLCRISIRESALGLYFGNMSDSRWVTKEDGSPETKIESFKGGISKALVRTAVKWGIGRYLYNLGDTKVPLHSSDWLKANKVDKDLNWIKEKSSGQWCAWVEPDLPKEFLP